jgi:hypothetical protein
LTLLLLAAGVLLLLSGTWICGWAIYLLLAMAMPMPAALLLSGLLVALIGGVVICRVRCEI